MNKIFLGEFRNRAAGFYGVLGLLNAAVWVWAFIALRDNPVLLGTAFVAYTLGLRHAIDADHIAAIDNVTRKLLQDGRKPVTVGFFFALGHSTIVLIASLVVYLTAAALEKQFTPFKQIGTIFATSVSAFFLMAIALINLFILRSVYRAFQRVRNNGTYIDQASEILLVQGGLMARIFRPLFRMLSRSWHMYPIGFLFGLGFETATEVAVLGISAAAATKGIPVTSMMVFPALFTAGMTLADTTDGLLMVGAYGWAFVKPIRKLYYNMTITFVSVVVALIVGFVEALGLLKDELNLRGGIWHFIGNLNDHFGTLGLVIIGVFAFSWIGSMILYRVKGFDRLESTKT
jgi:nickel/cobalt transporter (NiCoT) family protein